MLHNLFQLPFLRLFQLSDGVGWEAKGFLWFQSAHKKVKRYLSRHFHGSRERGVECLTHNWYMFLWLFRVAYTFFTFSAPSWRFIKVSFRVFNFVLIESFHGVPFCVPSIYDETYGAEAWIIRTRWSGRQAENIYFPTLWPLTHIAMLKSWRNFKGNPPPQT